MAYSNILCDVAADGIARITVNRPSKLNALNIATMGELEDAFALCERTLLSGQSC